jgi:beta-lactam-binding protein with PASTA domain/tRNA A-37 threonylcarbamoyl transferase component Bud32
VVAISRVIDRVGQVLGGRYRLLAPIGTGASATVYLADDVVLRRRVAVKVLHDALADDSQFLKRFRAEAHNAAALNHPHIMAVHDWGQGDVPYLVTELLGGGSLRALLDTGAQLDLAQARHVGLEAARALDYAHRRGLVHRDIKPANLLFDDEGRLRVADFGLARALAEAAWTEPAGAVLGTARYASPEQAQGAALDGRSDVYSLALVIIESVSGHVPFSADTTLGTLMARVDREVPVPPELGPLVPALMAAGSPDPEQRPDAEGFATLLMAAGDLGPFTALPLAGTTTLDDIELDVREPTTLYVAERQVRADFEPEIMTAPPGTTTNGLTIVTQGEAQPATRSVAREGEGDGDAAKETRAERRQRKKAEKQLAKDSGSPGAPVPVEVLQADSGKRTRRKAPMVIAVLAVVLVVGAGAAAAYVLTRTPTHTIVAFTSTTSAAEARAQLEAQGFVVEEVSEFSETVADGNVISQDPVAGTTLEEGATVSLTVSAGPKPVPVPTDIGGHSLEEVTVMLEAARLAVGQIYEAYDENWGEGVVLGPADGTPAELRPNTPVGLRVSAGPAPRTIPQGLSGGTKEAVTAQLQGLGLVVGYSEAYSETVEEGLVIQVNPGPGSTVARDSTVTVQVSLGKEPVTIPKGIVGMTVANATRALESRGLSVGGVKGNPSKPVKGTEPGVGSEVQPGSSVTLVTG